MVNNIEDKGSKAGTTSTILFNHLSNNDLIVIATAGELENFCHALSLDLHSNKNEKITTYEA
jgi:hypothetical protein